MKKMSFEGVYDSEGGNRMIFVRNIPQMPMQIFEMRGAEDAFELKSEDARFVYDNGRLSSMTFDIGVGACKIWRTE